MASPGPETAQTHTLSPQEAGRLWNWVLARQGLAPHTRRSGVEEITDAGLGLHAARLPSPFATVAARAADPSIPLELFNPAVRSRLLTVRCMRKTLHTLPLDLAAAAHAATLRFRERDALRAIVNAGHGHAAITAATAAIVELLGASGPLFHRTIEVQLGAAGTPVMVTRLALKLAWERGVLSYLNQAAGWNREVRVFTLTASTYPTLDTALDPHTAVELLMAAYLDRYGPISIKDATWWSALSRTAVTEALQRSGVKLVRLFTPWSHSPLYMSAQRFAEYTVAADADYLSGVNLLAHEDVALKAYFETRRRYLGDLAQQAAFNQIGEVLPTIVLDGRVVGTWRWDPSAGRVRHRLIPGLLPAARRPEVRAAAARHTAVLCSGLYHAPRPRIAPGQL
ncbi:DNA glycosylase AlkZ-like family protein [Nonomuraea ferruginea]|uniref:Winged helix DNA-binding domain-containing protein n=1 Tax=Nonomuraea ferruginea TaxID=46174 RepID=A0ABT4SRL6_9ACTN|nr:crosslink repair DNA glycosylase YcaQ family protein [Nonomuraea ferruginea]MDA0639794.1 winged helix DNA-binding domain-containing protein [Nonomuraea ferruginea]